MGFVFGSLKNFKRARICQDFVLLDSELLAQEASFYGLMSAFLLQIVSPRTSTLAPTGQLAEVTTRTFPPMMFAALPEYYVDDIGEFLVFLVQYDRSYEYMYTVVSLNPTPRT